ncbi:hypothetical protein [Brumimicrobium mesophilum]|uniref:hypothetical protein n=1 Tax=Brumimicrobium mesophilum TaxID=392717 RepID=UPI000D1425EC|nr:hypothetical protein [Brumimicrobium mesophilum]
MQKLLTISISILFSIGLYAQQNVYSGSDANLEYNVTVEKITDEVNDQFYDYYSIEIKNTSNTSVTFTPSFLYTTANGEEKKSSIDNDASSVTLAPGETVKGDISDHYHLTLFKEFQVGNSGKKSGNEVYTLKSVSINY